MIDLFAVACLIFKNRVNPREEARLGTEPFHNLQALQIAAKFDYTMVVDHVYPRKRSHIEEPRLPIRQGLLD